MSDRLKEFLRLWLEWAESDAPNGKPFYRWDGLCLNYWDWLERVRAETGEQFKISKEVDLLEAQFKQDGLNPDHPFGGVDRYNRDSFHESMHLNPARLAWVRSKVGQVAEA
jgi:hypothetical protein